MLRMRVLIAATVMAASWAWGAASLGALQADDDSAGEIRDLGRRRS